jgi:SpoVK/Ycf46/Vps4 family AAA+-type ATPase
MSWILSTSCCFFCRSSADEGDSGAGNGLHGRILSTFLNELDGILGKGDGSAEGARADRQVLVIAACQDLGVLDEALIRPG